MDEISKENKEKNRQHYNKMYADYSIGNILFWLKDLDKFIEGACSTETSWHALYQDNFKDRLKGKKVMEMGCGDCVNAAVMAGLGAEVYANDIAETSGEIIEKLNQAWSFKYPIKFVSGDFLENNLEAGQFDFVVGKAFLHHLTIPEEKKFLRETARLLKKEGEARFFEPAVNSKILDEIRWLVPVKGRPSKLSRKKFMEWKKNDPHPDRSFSSKHWEKVGKDFFKKVQIIPVGTLERFSRLMKAGKSRSNYRRWSFNAEKKIPVLINTYLTRSQLIIYKKPLDECDLKS